MKGDPYLLDSAPGTAFQKWYWSKENRTALNARRRARYAADVGGLATRHRARTAAYEAAVPRTMYRPDLHRARTIRVVLDGKQQRVHVVTAREIGRVLGRTTRTVTRWWHDEVIPPPIAVTRVGRGYWTIAQRECLLDTAKRCGLELRHGKPHWYPKGPAAWRLAAFTSLAWRRWRLFPTGRGEAWRSLTE